MALVAPSAAAFLARISAEYVRDLTTAAGDAAGSPPNIPRIEQALTDAHGELAGYMPRIPQAWLPKQATFDVHCTKVALYLLTLDRPGGDFVQIRTAYADTIAFYTNAITSAEAAGGSPPVEGSACKPPSVFNERSLKGFAS